MIVRFVASCCDQLVLQNDDDIVSNRVTFVSASRCLSLVVLRSGHQAPLGTASAVVAVVGNLPFSGVGCY